MLDAERDLETQVEAFHRDGFLVLPSVLSTEECGLLRSEIDVAMAELPQPSLTKWMRPQMFTRGPLFEDLLDRSPTIDLAERLLRYERGDSIQEGEGAIWDTCHVLNVTASVSLKDDEGDHWHIDDYLLMPRPKGVPWDERIPFPVHIISALYYLNDVGPNDGPTHVVPGSHKSGQRPDPQAEAPTYEGRGLLVVEARAGDCLIFHSQLWHRAGPHGGGRVRYVQQVHYAARFITTRFFPMPNYQMPPDLLLRLSPRRQRLLGMHPCRSQYT